MRLVKCYSPLKGVRIMNDNNYIEDSHTEVVRTFHETDKQTNNTVNVEQNINVVNIEMGKKSLMDRIDPEAVKEWAGDHMVQIIGGILVFYTVILFSMMMTVAKYKDIISQNEVQNSAAENIVQIDEEPEEAVEQITYVQVEPEYTAEMEAKSEEVKEEEIVAEETEETVVEEAEPEELPTEKDLYDLRIVGGTASEKRAKAVNTVGEELENVYYLTGGFYSETVGFYLNGEYDHFTGNISCDDDCKGGFNVNIYLDDGPCLQSIRVERLMARVPVDIDTTDATFIKFEITGSLYSQGAILSDGVLHIADSADD